MSICDSRSRMNEITISEKQLTPLEFYVNTCLSLFPSRILLEIGESDAGNQAIVVKELHQQGLIKPIIEKSGKTGRCR